MSNDRTLKLPEDLAAFAQTQVDTGHYGSVVEVVREAFGLLQDRAGKVTALRKELDVGIAELDAGKGQLVEPGEFTADIRTELGLPRNT